MYKSIVYPYDSEFSPILRHSSFLQNISIGSIVSPKGWGLCQKDASFADGGPIIGMAVADSNELGDTSYDSLLLVSSENELDFEKMILPKVRVIAESGKEILSARNLSIDEETQISSICDQYKVNHVEYAIKNEKFDDPFLSERLMDLDTPVIFVCGTAQNTSKFEIQLALRGELLNRGFKISQIGSRRYCEMLGFHSWPLFMTDKDYSENEKIVAMNHYIKCIELNEKPDLIMIGIPGGIIPIDNNATNEFGMTALELSRALLPDYVILSSLYEDYKEIYFTKVNKGVKNHFDFDIDAHIWSNTKAILHDFKHGGEINYLKISSDYITKKIKSFTNHDSVILNIYESNTPKYIADNMMEKLSQYGNMMTV